MLPELKEYGVRQRDVAPLLYQNISVRYVVELNGDGTLRNPVPIDRATGAGKSRSERGTVESVPNLTRTSSPVALPFADGSDYTFGVDPKGQPAKLAARHQLYVKAVEECAEATGEPAVRAVLAFLQRGAWPRFPDDFDYGAEVTFSVDGVKPAELPSVHRFWVDRYRRSLETLPEQECVVCGRRDHAVDTYPGRVKGVLGGQSAGTALVSANTDVFESYGLKGSQIAPTCLECADGLTKGLNHLIAGQKTHLYLGGSTFIFWARSGELPFDPNTLMTDPTSETVQDLLASVHSGRIPAHIAADRFFAAPLTGSGGRTVVRDWIDTTVGEVAANLADWFDRQRIVDWDGAEGAPFGLRQLAGGTIPLRRAGPDWDRLPATVSRAMLRAALTGAPLPPDILYRAVQRTHAERNVRRVHAALIKLSLLAQRDVTKEIAPVSLNPDHPAAAYHCGRLLAVLEEAQRAAMPRVTNTIVDRFYGAASSSPASVFGRLFRGAQPHLSTLENSNRGAFIAIQQKLEEVSSRIDDDFPATLTLKEQGLFALGYYHQRAHRNPRHDKPSASDPQNAPEED
ncbi:MAG: type I-C CRISPR-associated protein Cas8c/Csd1 [Dehalococcoidia bacterium]|nr:type I-C CRISPR-associated protein Cas8c/Csd1 [Dehalococcoidia bacterium]